MKMDRRKFLKALGIGGAVVIGGGLAYTVIDEAVDSPEDFEGFDEKKEDGWRVAICNIMTQGDVIYVTPDSKSRLTKIIRSKNEVSYSGDLRYRIKRIFADTPEKDLEAVRPGYVILKNVER
jgi:hypothetical protein